MVVASSQYCWVEDVISRDDQPPIKQPASTGSSATVDADDVTMKGVTLMKRITPWWPGYS